MLQTSNSASRKRIVVTGALGHIGSALIREPRLVEAATELILVDDFSTQRYASLFDLPPGTKYTLLRGDVESVVTPEALAGVSAVIHLAAIAEPSTGITDPNWLTTHNLGSTRHVAEACASAGVPLVFPSSTSVYAGTTEVVNESSLADNPQSPYAQCKLQEESLILDLVEDGLRAAVFRFGTIFGTSPGMRFHTAVNKFCWQAACGEDIEVWSTALDQRRPYLALSDATRLLARTALEGIFPGKVINAVSCNITVRDVLEAIEKCGYSLDVRLVSSPLMTSTSFETSTELAQSLGFEFDGQLLSAVQDTLTRLGRLGPPA